MRRRRLFHSMFVFNKAFDQKKFHKATKAAIFYPIDILVSNITENYYGFLEKFSNLLIKRAKVFGNSKCTLS